MIESNNKGIDTEQLLARIRDEVHHARARGARGEPHGSAEPSELKHPSEHQGTDRASITHDGGAIRKSWIHRLPVIGPFLLWVWSLVRLYPVRRTVFEIGRVVRQLVDASTSHQRQLHAQQRELETQQREVASLRREVEGRNQILESLGHELATQKQVLEAQQHFVEVHEERIGHLQSQEAQLSGRMDLVESQHGHRLMEVQTLLSQCRREILFQQRRLNRILDDLQGRMAAGGELPQARTIVEAGNQALAALYCSFEEAFRGSHEDIKQRFKVYLDELTLAGAGQMDSVVLDIGCGRGEWLELLGDNGLSARGIDMNPSMVEECQRRGLDVTAGDVLDYLKELPEDTLGAVTGFHIVEHLSLDDLVALFDQAYRALRSGGMLIFETPNPENIQVGACNFYHDPTHRNPLPPLVLEFVAQQRGYVETEIKRLHPYPENHLVAEDSELARRFNRFFYGPQDYALIARKA